ncbi:GNAT family N-acetyltransferase [Natranaerofaba carboxydovora]|uniref:GNAT family N-acetyltransferase n=1 Tax=Natranaerofaba carboxydovora TaxID=2742683 RepID=UPI001F132D10|nr:GNAT family N-acetyltransferase [Natranaerofaba carboxydovora]UMZ73744.1 Acetyltransferase (GNAT) family protein [Natranaerofaba carboxydovora]
MEVISLPAKKIPQAASVIGEAFLNEGFTKRMFNLRNKQSKYLFTKAMELKISIYNKLGQPMWVTIVDDQVVGVGVLKEYDQKKLPFKDILKCILPLIKLTPFLFRINYRNLNTLKRASEKPTCIESPHATLEALAVHPHHQGKGIGKLLIKKIHEEASKKDRISGIYLFTSDEKNKTLYEGLGYNIFQERNLDLITAYHMYYEFSSSS